MPIDPHLLFESARSLDSDLASWLHGHPQDLLTQAMLILTNAHGVAGATALSLLAAAYLLKEKHLYWLLALAITVPGGMLLNALLKHSYQRVRPHFDNPLLALASYSFPSGHTANATLFYGFLAAFLVSRARDWRRRALIFALALGMIGLVGFSRMYLGVHYLSDVAAGFVVMLAWLAVCLYSVDALRRRRTGRPLFS